MKLNWFFVFGLGNWVVNEDIYDCEVFDVVVYGVIVCCWVIVGVFGLGGDSWSICSWWEVVRRCVGRSYWREIGWYFKVICCYWIGFVRFCWLDGRCGYDWVGSWVGSSSVNWFNDNC